MHGGGGQGGNMYIVYTCSSRKENKHVQYVLVYTLWHNLSDDAHAQLYLTKFFSAGKEPNLNKDTYSMSNECTLLLILIVFL